MSPRQWQRVKEVAGAAFELEGGRRSTFLDRECGSDRELREAVEGLLEADRKPGQTIEEAIAAAAAQVAKVEAGGGRELRPGQTISHYTITAKLGEGGMGVVYKAQDSRLERPVALKFLPPHSLDEAAVRARFLQEAKAAGGLNHPNICTIHEIDEADGRDFIVMECIEGQSIKQKIEEGPLPLEQALGIAIQMGEGLQEAHERGIVHRDIKPSNVMLDRRGRVKILDFGLALVMDRTKLTKTGSTMGTPAYMSPEQALGEKLDQQSDIWSLGAVLYELVAGEAAFRGEIEAVVVYEIINTNPKPVSSLRPGLPSEMDVILSKALAKPRDERYRQMEDLLVDLRTLRASLARGEHRPLPGQVHTTQVLGAGSDQLVEHGGRASRMRIGILAVACILAVGLLAFWARTVGRGTPASHELSIAILPFTNLSSDPENEYFVYGLREELIQAMSGVEQLRVIKSAGKSEDVPEIASRLNVRAVLGGSVRKSGDRLRISASLMAPEDGHLLWSETYDREFKDVLAIQEDISEAIVRTLDLRLAGAQDKRLVRNSSVNLEAYSLYLKGRYTEQAAYAADDVEGVKKAMRYFGQAIAEDSGYAPAYAGLGDCYGDLYDYEALSPAEALPERRKAVHKALELDPDLPEAMATRGGVAVEDWDWPNAELYLKRAIELQPNNGVPHTWYGLVLAGFGRYQEGLAEIKRARNVDPGLVSDLVGIVLYWARQYDKALESLREPLDLHPSDPELHEFAGSAYLLQGAREQALEHLAKAAELAHEGSEVESRLGMAYAMCGRKDEAQQILNALIARSKERHVGSVNLARIYAGLGERDKAFECLDRAYRQGESEWPLHLVDPMWDTIASDPRFEALLRRVGLRR